MVKKKEAGTGIDYAVYITAIGIVVLITYFLIFYQKVIAVKSELLNGLQICENYILATEEHLLSDEEGAFSIEQELVRPHIITEHNPNSTTVERKEGLQVKDLAMRFSERIKKFFYLNDSNYPQTGILHNLNENQNKNKLLISKFEIYEAVYDSVNNVSGYIRYSVTYKDNIYISCTKTLLPADTRIGDQSLCGSTVYAELSCSIVSPDHITEYPIRVSACVDIKIQ